MFRVKRKFFFCLITPILSVKWLRRMCLRQKDDLKMWWARKTLPQLNAMKISLCVKFCLFVGIHSVKNKINMWKAVLIQHPQQRPVSRMSWSWKNNPLLQNLSIWLASSQWMEMMFHKICNYLHDGTGKKWHFYFIHWKKGTNIFH